MKTVLLSIITILFIACSTNDMEKDYKRLKSENINLPQYQTFIINGKECSNINRPNGKLKLIVFCDSTSCNSCAIEAIYSWEDYIKYAEKLENQLCYYFIFTPRKKDIANVRTTLDMTDFNYPIVFDSTGFFRKLNPHIPMNKMFHTFLIDGNNRIVMVGNPLHDSETESLFKTTVEKLLSEPRV
mgnify:FL=1